MTANNIMAYGINTLIIEWGFGVEEWDKAKSGMLLSQVENAYVNSGAYNTNSVIPYNTNSVIPITQIVTIPVTHSNHPDAVSPDVARPEGTLTERTDINTEKDSNNLPQDAPAVLDDNELKLVPPPKKTPAKAPPKQPAEPKPETPQQKAIRDAYETLLGEPLKVGKRGYPGLLTLIQRHGIPIVYEWAKAIGTITVPEGADTWQHFCTRFTEGLNRKWEWQKDNTNNATQSKRTKTGGLNPPTDPAEFTNGKAKL